MKSIGLENMKLCVMGILALVFLASVSHALAIQKHNDTWLVTGFSKALDIRATTSATNVVVYSYQKDHWVKVFSGNAKPGLNHWIVSTDSNQSLIYFPGDSNAKVYVKPTSVQEYATYNETCGNGIGYSIPDTRYAFMPHYCQGGKDCCNWYVKAHVHDLQTTLDGNYTIYLTYRPGLASGCSSPLRVYVSPDNSTWTMIFNGTSKSNDMDGNPAYPQRWEDYSLTLHYDGKFRWVKVSIPKCFVDWSYITVTNNTNNQPPVANFTVDKSKGYPPLLVLFNASSSYDPDGGSLTYHWRFGDGSGANVPEILHTYRTPGNVTVELEVSDSYGAEDIMHKHIFIGHPIKITRVGAVSYNGHYYSGSNSVTISFIGDTDSGYNISVNGNVTHVNTTTDSLNLSDGNNTICVTGYLGSSNSTDCVNISVEPNPVCKITGVATYKSSAYITYSCNMKMDKVYFWTNVNNTVLVDKTPGLTRIPNLPDGRITIYLLPHFITGINGTEMNATVNINANPPKLVWISPSENQVINTSAVNVSVYSPSPDVAQLSVMVKNSTWNSTWQPLTLSAIPNRTYSLVISGLSTGNYTALVNATDNASNSQVYSRNFTINATLSMPSVSIVFPAKTKAPSNPSLPYIFYNWTCNNNTVSMVQFYVNDSGSSTYSYKCSAYLDGNYQGSVSNINSNGFGEIDFSNVVSSQGYHVIKVVCVDQSNPMRVGEKTVKFYVDSTPPTVSFTGPNGAEQFPNNFHNGTYWTNNMKIFINSADKHPGVYRVYISIMKPDGSVVDFENTSSPSGWFQPDLSKLNGDDQNYTMCVYAEDYVGNTSPKECRKVTYNTHVPSLVIGAAPADGILFYSDVNFVECFPDNETYGLTGCRFNYYNNETNKNYSLYTTLILHNIDFGYNTNFTCCYADSYVPDCNNPNDYCYHLTAYGIDWAGNVKAVQEAPFGVAATGPNVTIDSIQHDPKTDKADITFHVSVHNATKVEYRYEYLKLNSWDVHHGRPCGNEIAYSSWYPVDGNVSDIVYPLVVGREATFHVDDLPESGYFCNGTRFDPRIELMGLYSYDYAGSIAVSKPLYVNSWWRKIEFGIIPSWSDAVPYKPFDVYVYVDYNDTDLRFHDQFQTEEHANLFWGKVTDNTSLFDFNLTDNVHLPQYCRLYAFRNYYSGLVEPWWNVIKINNQTWDGGALYAFWPGRMDDPGYHYVHYLNSSLASDYYRSFEDGEVADFLWRCDALVTSPYTLKSTLRLRLWNGTIITKTVKSVGQVVPYSPPPGSNNTYSSSGGNVTLPQGTIVIHPNATSLLVNPTHVPRAIYQLIDSRNYPIPKIRPPHVLIERYTNGTDIYILSPLNLTASHIDKGLLFSPLRQSPVKSVVRSRASAVGSEHKSAVSQTSKSISVNSKSARSAPLLVFPLVLALVSVLPLLLLLGHSKVESDDGVIIDDEGVEGDNENDNSD